jgi:hypothetical protein
VTQFQAIGSLMASIALAKAKQLCTASELQLVESSRRPEVARLGVSQLKSKIQRARKLRDKWRDMHEKQRRRAQQQGSRVTKGETRSRQKAELFSDVLNRLEGQLKKIDAPDAGSGKTASKPTSRPSKKERSEAHRQARAQTRKQLDAKREEAQRPPSGAAAPETQPAKVRPKKAIKKGKASKKRAKRPERPSAPPASDPKPTQRTAAKTAAKRDRIKVSGLTTRTRGHVSARGKRSQTRRDKRN